MKKYLICLLIVIMLSFSAVSARDTEVVDATTLGWKFGWTHTYDEVWEFFENLGGYEMESGQDFEQGLYIKLRCPLEDKVKLYSFTFDSNKKQLFAIEMIELFYDDNYVPAAYEKLVDAYDLTSVPEYIDSVTKDYISTEDEGFVVAGDKTIAAVGVTYANDQYYGHTTLLLIDREYFES